MLAKKPVEEWDVSALLKLIWETWHDVFKKTLGFAEKNLVSELRNWRNKWPSLQTLSESTKSALFSGQKIRIPTAT